jgi:hypothetical protein
MLSDASERLDLHFNSANIDSDLNESSSSKSNQGDPTENINLDSSHQTVNIRPTAATTAIPTTNRSRSSATSNPGQLSGRGVSGRMTSIMERRRSPDMLLKRWIKNQNKSAIKSDGPVPLSVSCSLFNLKFNFKMRKN